VADYASDGLRHLVLRVHCSRGTYVRSIAHDLGQKLGCGGHLSYLLRERVGQYAFSHAFPYWKIEKAADFSNSPAFVNIGDILPYPRLKISTEAEFRVKNGQALGRRDIVSLETENQEISDTVQILAPDGRLLAVYDTGRNRSDRAENQKQGLKLFPVRVFSENEA